ncbi:unnamed protein product [Amoebophrya sp. A120]|nr:unnamed protein product [Amoebophrya sp. A120]|eukprot:GSA120T00019252001.1
MHRPRRRKEKDRGGGLSCRTARRPSYNSTAASGGTRIFNPRKTNQPLTTLACVAVTFVSAAVLNLDGQDHEQLTTGHNAPPMMQQITGDMHAYTPSEISEGISGDVPEDERPGAFKKKENLTPEQLVKKDLDMIRKKQAEKRKTTFAKKEEDIKTMIRKKNEASKREAEREIEQIKMQQRKHMKIGLDEEVEENKDENQKEAIQHNYKNDEVEKEKEFLEKKMQENIHGKNSLQSKFLKVDLTTDGSDAAEPALATKRTSDADVASSSSTSSQDEGASSKVKTAKTLTFSTSSSTTSGDEDDGTTAEENAASTGATAGQTNAPNGAAPATSIPNESSNTATGSTGASSTAQQQQSTSPSTPASNSNAVVHDGKWHGSAADGKNEDQSAVGTDPGDEGKTADESSSSTASTAVPVGQQEPDSSTTIIVNSNFDQATSASPGSSASAATSASPGVTQQRPVSAPVVLRLRAPLRMQLLVLSVRVLR